MRARCAPTWKQPIFRAVGSQGSYLSNAGVALGGGVDIKIWLLHVPPEVRYAHWAKDRTVTAFIAYPSKENQTEFLIGIGLGR